LNSSDKKTTQNKKHKKEGLKNDDEYTEYN